LDALAIWFGALSEAEKLDVMSWAFGVAVAGWGMVFTAYRLNRKRLDTEYIRNLGIMDKRLRRIEIELAEQRGRDSRNPASE